MLRSISRIQLHQFTQEIEPTFPEIRLYSESFIARRIPHVMNKMNCLSWDSFLLRTNTEQFIEEFLSYFIVSGTEFFRDASLWQLLYHKILPKIATAEPCNIWIPDCPSGEELFSLCMLLDMLGMRNQVTITAGCKSKKIISTIKSAKFPLESESLLTANFKSLSIPKPIEHYYTKNRNALVFSEDLLSQVDIVHANSVLSQYPKPAVLVLYRNILLYANPNMQHKIITHIYNNISFGGYFILGMKENMSIFGIDSLFKLEYKQERIYRKK